MIDVFAIPNDELTLVNTVVVDGNFVFDHETTLCYFTLVRGVFRLSVYKLLGSSQNRHNQVFLGY